MFLSRTVIKAIKDLKDGEGCYTEPSAITSDGHLNIESKCFDNEPIGDVKLHVSHTEKQFVVIKKNKPGMLDAYQKLVEEANKKNISFDTLPTNPIIRDFLNCRCKEE